MHDHSQRDAQALAGSFDEHPAIVVWELTRACRLACRHCRAEARPFADPNELTPAESLRVLEQVAACEPILLILTGGDPSRRDDLLDLIRQGRALGVRVALSPSATPDFLRMDFESLREAGVCRVSLSLDGASAASHNRFRGVARAWDWTMEAARRLRQAGIGLQINSTVTAQTIREFDSLAEVVEMLAPSGWTLFLVVPTGRATASEMPTAAEVEELFGKLREFSKVVSFEIRTTEGQHYRRVLAQHGDPVPAPVNDAKGFVFISHVGEVCPSGFLPLVAGNVRQRPLLDIYRDAPLFRELRDPSLLRGKCGRCGFNERCGGSRARACATTGDYLAEEPLCIYQP